MKWAFSSVGMVAAGLVGIMIILLFQELTVNNEEEYYLLKEITEAAMIDSVDLAYYRDKGRLKIVQEKFVENFVRRFAESASVLNTKNYSIEFFDIMEMPPKASVILHTTTRDYTIFGNTFEPQDYGVENSLDAILEFDDPADNVPSDSDCYKTLNYISNFWINVDTAGNEGSYTHSGMFVIPPDGPESEANWYLDRVDYVGRLVNRQQKVEYNLNRENMFYNATSSWDVTDPESWEALATSQTLRGSIWYDRASEGHGHNKLWYSVDYHCESGHKLTTTGGNTIENGCMLGILYTVTWRKTTPECSFTETSGE